MSTDVNGEIILFNVDKGNYYGLDAQVGTRIWELLECPKTLSELCALLIQEFDVESNQCYQDTRLFVADLARQGLVEISRSDNS